ncbi:MAG: MotA/TolQ/ExbB proton channel family protein [Chitinophagaceae bacterium]|nr:MotA/TolQ/ExbB proton channel family protein [Chitinophagaceae bacterium]MBK8788002.1 MotA/TolQ/ExbB proton channel family protein [Chitinophagaceae bacterium]MBK9483796.1 MotA/TolQ/ExbB proton channel family protein [Chitinophagaceae bacterium]MBL0200643.1 MotA/TolQ/ExbB proton channel family protein [Chitinophagaceae bacterium]
MAETTATVKPTTSVQAKKSSNIISLIAPVLCLLAGYFIWRIVLGNPANFGVPTVPGDEGWFWPGRHDPKSALSKMYLGGIIVPVLIGTFLTMLTFVIERFMTITKANGTGNNADFIRKVQYQLANKNVDAALAECDKQKGSVGNVMKAGLHRYKEMISNTELSTDQKVMAIQKEVEEATSLELPMLEKNLVFLSSIASLATLIGLLGTVVGMIRAFGTLGSDSGGSASAQALSVGISEALYNTALGIGTSAFAIMFYNIFTTKIDGITYGIDESGFTLTQTFASLYK